ncbi:MAG TPA: L-rhamnose mutarotase [Staphylococcus sp.]|nr:L-rhamnose mutarotase [Staphylococcus sp.]
MTRIATLMYVNEGSYEEYKRRHDTLWPEMKQLLKDSGVYDYSIFLNEENGELFAVLHVKDKKIYDNIAQDPVCQKWWEYMADIMQVNEDNSPKAIELKEMFYLK